MNAAKSSFHKPNTRAKKAGTGEVVVASASSTISKRHWPLSGEELAELKKLIQVQFFVCLIFRQNLELIAKQWATASNSFFSPVGIPRKGLRTDFELGLC